MRLLAPVIAALALAAIGTGCLGATGRTEQRAGAAGETEPIPVDHSFQCDSGAVGAELDVAEVAGAHGHVSIRPAGDCTFDLLHRSAPGATAEVLSAAPGGYLLVAAASGPTGETVVCGSNVHHEADPEAASAGGAATFRRSTSVPLECASLRGHQWARTRTVVAAEPTWAAWIVDVVAGPEPHRFRIRWIRDASFQFLNVTDRGRPPTDGLWETAVDLDGSGLTVRTTQQLSHSVVPALRARD